MPLYQKLRQPEFDKRRSAASLKLYLENRAIDIASPFPPWELPESPDWTESPHNDDTWGLYYHSLGWLIVLDHGIDHAPDEDQRQACRVKLRELFFSYLRCIGETAEPDCPKMMWFDHATAWRASAIAYLVDKRFSSAMEPDEEVILKTAVRLHEDKILEFIKSGRWNANNHGLFHAEALWDMSLVFDFIGKEVSEIALSHMRTVFSSMIDLEEGVCREQSIYYHLFDAWLLAESAKYMRSFDVDVIPGYTDVLKKMVRFYSDFSGGGEILSAIGDTQYGRKYANRLLADIFKAIGEPEPARECGAAAVTQLVEYPKNGYYFFKSRLNDSSDDAGFAVFIDKPYLGAHGHWDGGSFTIDYGGTPFIVDSGGPYAYGKPLRFSYFKTAEAHNVLLAGKKSSSYLTEATSVTRGANGNAVRLRSVDMKDVVWQRTLAALDGGAFILIDRVTSKIPQSFDLLMHMAPDVELSAIGENRFSLSSGGRSLEVLFRSNKALTCNSIRGDSGFPRGLITRELGTCEASPVLSTEVTAADAWVVTVVRDRTESDVIVHSLYSGKVVRVFVPGATPKVVDCNVDDPAVPVRIYSYRAH